MSRPILLVGAALLALGLALWIPFGSGAGSRPGPGGTTPTPPQGADPLVGAASSEAGRDGTAAAAAARRRVSSAGDPGLRTFLLRGRCVHGDEDEPAPGVQVTLEPDWFGLDASDSYLAESWPRPRPVVTGEDGSFELRVTAAEFQARLVTAPPWYSHDVGADMEGPEDEETDFVDVGEVQVERGFPVAGSVCDSSGRPLESGMLRLDKSTARIHEGRFDLGHIAGGEYEPELLMDAGQIVSPQRIRVGKDLDTRHLRLQAHVFPSVEGVVLRPDGKPEPRFLFEASWHHGSSYSVRTDTEGRFVAPGFRMGSGHVMFRNADEREGDRCLVADGFWHAVPGPQVVLRTRPWRRVKLRVLWDDGRPVSAYQVRDSVTDVLRRVGPFVDGVATFEGFAGTEDHVRVEPEGYERAWFEWLPVRPDDTGSQLHEVTLPALRSLEVELVVPGLKGGRRNVSAHAQLEERSEEKLHTRSYARSVYPDPMSIWVPRRCVGLVMNVHASRYQRRVTLTEEHERSGKLRVVFEPKPAPRHARLDLRLVGGVETLPKRFARDLFAIRRAGTTRLRRNPALLFDGLPPGDWEVLRHTRKKVWTGIRTSKIVRGEETVLHRVHLDPGQHRIVDVDVSDLTPGRIQGSVTHAGAPLRNTSLHVRSVDGVYFTQCRSDDAGRFDSSRVPPGRYLVTATGIPDPGITEDRRIAFSRVIQVAAGAAVNVDLVTEDRTLEVRAVDAEGTPLANAWFYVYGYGGVRSDASGRFRIHPVPSWEMSVRLRAGPGETERVEVITPEQAKRASVVLRFR